MANEKREQRKKERSERRLRRADERSGILTAMDAKRSELSSAPTDNTSTATDRKPGTIKIKPRATRSTPPNPRPQTTIEAIDQPSEKAATEAILTQKSFLETQEPKPVENPSAVNIPASGATLFDAVAKGGGDFNEITKAAEDAKEANKNEIELNSQLASETEKALTAIGQLPTKPATPLATIADEERDLIPTEPLPGDGRTLVSQKFMQVQPGQRPTASQITTKEDLYGKILEANKDLYDQVPKAVLEKLSVEDYYPNIRKDIAVGTYQGKYLGSATIFSAPGGRVPLGLYDARQRALSEAAKAKQKQIDDILSTPETSPQYQALFNESFYNMLESELSRVGYDFDAFSRDPQALRNVARYEAKAKEITAAVTFADTILEAGKNDATYVPQELIDLSKDIKYAQINNLDDILAGKANAVEPLKKAQIYKDLVPEVQKLARDLLDPARMKQSPINLKTGGQYDSESWIKERNDFFVKVRSGIGWEEYATGINKYFDGDYKGIIENLVKGRGGSEDQIEPMQKMFAEMIQPQIILDYENVKNDEVEVMKLRERQRQFNINREDRQNNFWGNINGGLTNNPPTVDGKPIDKAYDEALKEVALIKDPKERAKKMREVANKYQVGSISYDSKNDVFVYTNGPSPKLAQDGARPEQLTNADGKPIKYIRGEYFDGKNWVAKNFTPAEISTGWASNKKLKLGGVVYDPKKDKDKEQLDKWADVPGSVYVKTVGFESKKAFLNKQGKPEYLRADGSNLEEYLSSSKQMVYTIPIEKPFYRRSVSGAVSTETTYIDEELPGVMLGTAIDINNRVNQQWMNNQSGYNPLQAAESISEGDSYNYSGSSWQ